MAVLKGEGRVLILFGDRSVTSGALTHRTYLARPDLAGEWPTILIVPGVGGITSPVKDVARRLARHGFAATVVDPYRGATPPASSDPDGGTAGFASGRLERDIGDIVAYVTNPAGFWSSAEDGFAVLGLNAGGPTASRVARAHGAALLLVSSAGDPAAMSGMADPILGLAGKDDAIADVEAVGAARAAAPHAEWVLYEGAGEDFFDDAREGFDQQAFDDAIERIVAFSDKHLPPAP